MGRPRRVPPRRQDGRRLRVRLRARVTSRRRPMSIRGSWRVSLRIARRDVLRAKGRNLLVVLMIGIPVLLVAGLSLTLRSVEAGDESATLRSLGAAEALVQGHGHQPLVQHPTERWLYDGDEQDDVPWTAGEIAKATNNDLASVQTGRVLLTTEAGGLGVQVRELDLRNKLTKGLAKITDGRAPERANEVLVTAALAERGMGLGGTVRVRDGKAFTVAGIVRVPEDLKGMQLVALPGALLGEDGNPPEYLVGGPPLSWKQVRALNEQGLYLLSRAVLRDPPPTSEIAPKMVERQTSDDSSMLGTNGAIGGIVVLEIVLLAGPAFAVGARRQSRQLALFVVTGGTPKDVRRVVLAQALVLGFATAVLGCAVGVVGFLAARPVIENFYGKAIPDVALDPGDFGMLIGAGVLAALAAALVPAIQTSRQDAVAVLGGRRGELRTKRRWPIAGVVIAAIGVAILVLQGFRKDAENWAVVAGTVALSLGAILIMPAVVGLAGRFAGRLPLPLRLAARDTSRHRSRTVPAVAAIMGTVLTVTAMSVAAFSTLAMEGRDYQPREPMGTLTGFLYGVPNAAAKEAERAVEHELPGREVAVLYEVDPYAAKGRMATLVVPGAGCKGPGFPSCKAIDRVGRLESYSLAVVTPEGVEALLRRKPTAAEAKTLAAGGVLVPVEAALTQRGTAYLQTYLTKDTDGKSRTDTKRLEVPALVFPPITAPFDQKVTYPGVISEQTAERLGLAFTSSRVVVPPGEPAITKVQQARVDEIVGGLVGFTDLYVERGYDHPAGTYLFLLLALIGGLIVLVGTSTSTALALDDAKADFATLAAIGAGPGTRRATAMGQAVVIAVLGVVAGVAVGIVPGIALTYPITAGSAGGHIVDIPWELLGIVAVGVPLLAILGAGVFTRGSLTLVRRAE
ncbi:FtsX-like permease family protein [Tenggerimyces flavus]